MEKINIKKVVIEAFSLIKGLALITVVISLLVKFSSNNSIEAIKIAVSQGSLFLNTAVVLLIGVLTFVLHIVLEVLWWIMVFAFRKLTGYKFK